jgi:hypothetical protein
LDRTGVLFIISRITLCISEQVIKNSEQINCTGYTFCTVIDVLYVFYFIEKNYKKTFNKKILVRKN